MPDATVGTTIPTTGWHGRYVRVYQNLPTGADGYLSLAEVQVFVGATDVAVGHAASQISTYAPGQTPSGDASYAVDGNTSGNWPDATVSHTATDNHDNWWQVDLGSVVNMDSIGIWGRTDCCSIRLRDYYVFVSDTPFSSTDTIETLLPGPGSIGAAAGASLTLTNTVKVNTGTLSFVGAGTVAVNGVISGPGSISVDMAPTGQTVLPTANTFTGDTTVTGGTLNTGNNNSLGTSFTTSTLRVVGTTSVVNLGGTETKVGTANFGTGLGTVNTGAGKLHVASSMILTNYYTITGDFTAQGANLVDNAVQRDLAEVTGTMTVTHPPAPLTITQVDAPSPIVQLATQGNLAQVGTAPFTVTGGNVLVVDLGQRNDVTDLSSFTVTWDNGAGGGPVPLTLAARATYAPAGPLFSRDSSIWYLYNPLPGAGTLSVQTAATSTGPESFISAFTLANVDTTSAPIAATSSNAAGIASPVALNNVAQGSWLAIAEGAFNGTVTFSWTAVGAGAPTGYQLFQNPGINTSMNFGIFQNVSQGAPTDNYSIAAVQTGGAAASRDNRTVAAFGPALSTTGITNLPATNISLPAGTSLHLNNNGTATLGNISLLAAGTTVTGGTSTPTSLVLTGLSGLGSVNLPLTVNSQTSPGIAGPGTLTATSGVSLKTGSTFSVDINGGTAGTQYDQLVATGAISLTGGVGTGATLVVTAPFTPAVNQTFTIIKNNTGNTIVGTFNGLAEASTFVVSGKTFRVNYNVGASKDVVLTYVGFGSHPADPRRQPRH